eukprot:612698-Prorocentrum_minimum.AAC.1
MHHQVVHPFDSRSDLSMLGLGGARSDQVVHPFDSRSDLSMLGLVSQTYLRKHGPGAHHLQLPE